MGESSEQEEQWNDVASYMLIRSHEFASNVLSYLPARSLARCSRVCKSWYTISKRLLKSRNRCSWSCISALENEYFVDSVECSHRCGRNFHMLNYFERDLIQCLENIWSLPSHAIVFTEVLTARKRSKRHNCILQNFEDIAEGLRLKLPEASSILCLCTPGTVGTNRKMKVLEESEGEGGISCLLIPEMAGVRIHPFSVNETEIKSFRKKSSLEMANAVCGGPLNSVKCVLFFVGMTPDLCQTAEELQKTFSREVGRIPVIAGAAVNQIKTTESLIMAGLVFSGPQVRAASVMLSEDIDTKEEVEAKLGLFKSLNLDTDRSIGFMFACIGRGVNHYDEMSVESKSFRKCFPKTPLFGLFGNGEIGCDNLTLMMETDDEPKMNEHLAEIVHGYTTIIVMISFS